MGLRLSTFPGISRRSHRMKGWLRTVKMWTEWLIRSSPSESSCAVKAHGGRDGSHADLDTPGGSWGRTLSFSQCPCLQTRTPGLLTQAFPKNLSNTSRSKNVSQRSPMSWGTLYLLGSPLLGGPWPQLETLAKQCYSEMKHNTKGVTLPLPGF